MISAVAARHRSVAKQPGPETGPAGPKERHVSSVRPQFPLVASREM